MSLKNKIIAAILALLGVGGVAYSQLGSAIPGLAADVATSTENFTVRSRGTVTAQMLFATSTDCAARVITTHETAILLAFNDKVASPTPAIGGIFQAASTTATYDAGLYGCGLVKVIGYGDNAITIITVLETR